MSFLAFGDLIHVVLDSVGATKLPPPSCGCGARRDWINNVGYKIQYEIAMFSGGPGEISTRKRINTVARRTWRMLCKTTTSK